MRSKSFISIGLASALLVPSFITAANPQLVHAKTASKEMAASQPEIEMVSSKISTKAKAVIKKISEINPKKSNYIAKVLDAEKAYKKLSTKDKKMVKNYSTLKNYLKKIQPMLKQVASLKTSVAGITTKNYKTKAPSAQKAFQKMSVQTAAAVPTSTKTTLTNYVNLASASNSLTKLKTLSVATPSATDTTSKNGPAIMNFITDYKKLKPTQKDLLINDQPLIDAYLKLEEVAKGATDVEKKYAALNKKKSTYVKDAVGVYRAYVDASNEEKDYMPNESSILDFYTKYGNEINAADNFTERVGELGDSSDLAEIKNLVDSYKDISKKNSEFPNVAPIDLVDKATLKTYSLYEPIPKVIQLLDTLPSYPDYFTQGDATKANTMYTLYKKLGAPQKAMVQLETRNPEYLTQEPNFKAAQAIDKKYDAAKKKASIPDLLKVANDYNNMTEEGQYFVVNHRAIEDIAMKYLGQINAADDFEQEMADLANDTSEDVFTRDLAAINNDYKNLSKYSPSALPLVDKATIKSYTNFNTVPGLLKNLSKIYAKDKVTIPSYTPDKLNKILAAIKTYNKLDKVQKYVVDSIYPAFPDLVADEKNIKAAQAIDKKFAALKKSSKTYPKDAKKVVDAYEDGGIAVKPYVINGAAISNLINESTYAAAKDKADEFTDRVNDLSYKTPLSDLEDVESFYNKYVAPNPHVLSIVDAKTITTYKSYVAALTTINYLDLVYGTTARDIQNLKNAIASYNKLSSNARYIVDHADNANLDLINEEANLKNAQEIDDAYNAVKVNNPNFETDLLKVYKRYWRAPEAVQQFVVSAPVLLKQYAKYEPFVYRAMDFEDNVNELLYTSPISDVAEVNEIYKTDIKTEPILEALVDPDVMKDLKKFQNILMIQEISSYLYDNDFRNNLMTFDGNHWHYKSQYTPDIIKIVQAYDELDPKHKAIINTAINKANANILARNSYPVKPDVYPEEDTIMPMEYLLDTKNVEKAIALDDKFKALKPNSSMKDQLAVWTEYNKPANANAIKYVVNYESIEAIATTFSNELNALDAFTQNVKNLSADSTVGDVANVVKAYGNMPPEIQSMIDKAVLTTYKQYAPVNDLDAIISKLPYSNYTDDDIKNMLDAIAIYKKLGKNQKSVLANNYVVLPEFLADENEIKAAQKIDAQYKALNPDKPTYQTDLANLYKAFSKTNDQTKEYIVNIDALTDLANQYNNPQTMAKNFENLVNGLSFASTYPDVQTVYNYYQTPMDDKAKSLVDKKVMDTYNKYANIIEINKLLSKVVPNVIQYKPSEIEYISQAIALYNKLDKPQKMIIDNSPEIVNKDLLLDEASLIAAQDLDKKIEKIKPGTPNFDRSVVEAGKIYDMLSSLSKAYVQNAARLDKYRQQSVDDSINDAIDKIVRFESGVKDVAKLDTDETPGYQSEILRRMIDLAALNKTLNKDAKVNDSKIKLISLVDRKVLTDYQYYFSVYKVQQQLNDLENNK